MRLSFFLVGLAVEVFKVFLVFTFSHMWSYLSFDCIFVKKGFGCLKYVLISVC